MAIAFGTLVSGKRMGRGAFRYATVGGQPPHSSILLTRKNEVLR
jgi:hypothetical protein